MSDWDAYYIKELEAHIRKLEEIALEENQLFHRLVGFLKEQKAHIKALEGVVEAAKSSCDAVSFTHTGLRQCPYGNSTAFPVSACCRRDGCWGALYEALKKLEEV